MSSTQLIDLSPGMKVRAVEWKRVGHDLDVKLLNECAYYPRSGCQYCTWNLPNRKCRYAHILIDTRIEEVPGWVASKSRRRLGTLTDWEKLPLNLQEEIRKIISQAEGEVRENE